MPAKYTRARNWAPGIAKIRDYSQSRKHNLLGMSLSCNFTWLCIQAYLGPLIVGSYGRSRSASPGSGSRIRKYSPRRWFSRKSLEPVQIKVYEVDDMERVQKAMDPDFQVKNVTRLHVSFAVSLSYSVRH